MFNIFIQEWSDFFPIIGDKSPKSDMKLTDLATDECEQFCPLLLGSESQRKCQHLTTAFGGMARVHLELTEPKRG